MNVPLRKAISELLKSDPKSNEVITSIDLENGGTGTINYNTNNIRIDTNAPGFTNGRTRISDEELVRAYLLFRLISHYKYPATTSTIELEKVYKPVGRPSGKGGRIDVLVRKPKPYHKPEAFLFIECKAPDKFDSDIKYIDGQLFRLSRQETTQPRFLVYYTVELKGDGLHERIILIDTSSFSDFQSWDNAGQPITDIIPKEYGVASKRRYANVFSETDVLRPLDKETTPETFNRLRTEIHDVIWGGGGTNNNEVFVIITRLILCKIFDEKECNPNSPYRFQRLGDALSPETPDSLINRMNDLYRQAENSYLALTKPSPGPAFDTSRVSAEKLAYVVGRLESISITENNYPGDLLGEFFEQIVSQDFTQTRGQFFTPVKLVRFMLLLAHASDQAKSVMLNLRDHLGRPRLPYVIDPACGSGTFLIEYMKLIQSSLGTTSIANTLPKRIRESHSVWFSGVHGNVWAREFLFGIENNYDLGLSAKVNMVLHGDGSMNIWIKSALLPFQEYWVEGRNNLLGNGQSGSDSSYAAKVNQQFDLVLSNPPFSIKLAPDEKQKIADAFDLMTSAQSEAIFIERWYQLLREGGTFCCILPEAILDTSTYDFMRFFLIKNFRIHAVISLPYDTFRPFTSTKTCIVCATKRSNKEVSEFNSILSSFTALRTVPTASILQKTLSNLGWGDNQIFMAEPALVGYKRRKNLPDLPQANELYQEDENGNVEKITPDVPVTVIDYFNAGKTFTPNSKLGFFTTLKNVTNRDTYRLDPKYRWLWDYQQGVAFGDSERAVPLSTILRLVDLTKVPKGELNHETKLVDLENVESRQAILNDDIPIVDNVGSDKVTFSHCDLAISKLEPYLGKVIISPENDSIGSTEWVGLELMGGIPKIVAAYLLMLPDMCDAYRRLQSGKRHARFNPKEFIQLRVQLPPISEYDSLATSITEYRRKILDGRRLEQVIRLGIDDSFSLK